MSSLSNKLLVQPLSEYVCDGEGLDVNKKNTDEVETKCRKITVVCLGDEEFETDLDLFPSEMLRAVAVSEFADNKKIRIPFTAEAFLSCYGKYSANIESYLQIKQDKNVATIEDVVLITYDTVKSEVNNVLNRINVGGKIRIAINNIILVLDVNIVTSFGVCGERFANQNIRTTIALRNLKYRNTHGYSSEFKHTSASSNDLTRGMFSLSENDYDFSKQNSYSYNIEFFENLVRVMICNEKTIRALRYVILDL
jgi:hypothetical protein